MRAVFHLSPAAARVVAEQRRRGPKAAGRDLVSALIECEDRRWRRALRHLDWPRPELGRAVEALLAEPDMSLGEVAPRLTEARLPAELTADAAIPEIARSLLALTAGVACGSEWLCAELEVAP